MKESIINRLSAISENERSVLSDGYGTVSGTDAAFANMPLRPRN